MEEIMYTKGPWNVDVWNYDKADPPRKEIVIENGEFRIAVLDCNHGQENPYTIQDDEALANARLIAAAPDLLDAAQEALSLLYRIVNHLGGFTSIEKGTETSSCRGRLEAAIAKATGK
jgi:hypothetical protein